MKPRRNRLAQDPKPVELGEVVNLDEDLPLRAGALELDLAALTALLRLPDGHAVADISATADGKTVRLLVTGPSLPVLDPGLMAPLVRVVTTRELGATMVPDVTVKTRLELIEPPAQPAADDLPPAPAADAVE